MRTPTGNMDPYVYPETNVLRNLRDIRDPDRLSKFEMDMTTRRVAELQQEPIVGRFDSQHIKTIHRHIFQDVYAWAGEFRTVDISRSGQFPFAFSQPPEFCNRAAHYMGELNAIHPFRDGNGRMQREFIRQLAERNGYAIDWTRISRDQMTEASKLSFQRGDNSGLEKVLSQTLSHDRSRDDDRGDDR